MNYRNTQRSQSRVYGTIIFSTSDRILVVQGRETGKWSFPKGHKNNVSESPLECALRETWEECGLTLGKGYLEMIQLAAGRYFVYRLEDEPKLLSHDNNEIMDMRWVELEKLGDLNNNCDIRSYIMRGHMERHKKELALHEKMETYGLGSLVAELEKLSVVV